ncbi:MAG: YcgN family cysteine cluster protein [Pseudomonadota bacterium]
MRLARPFWETKTLDEMSASEWESLCDGCGKCCLNKLEEEDTGDLYWTDVSCRLLDTCTARCKDYAGRLVEVPDCVQLTPEAVRTLRWLPRSCAYRRLEEGRGLAWWHPLVSGDPKTVYAAGISVRNRTVSEDYVAVEDLEDRLVFWPNDDELET